MKRSVSFVALIAFLLLTTTTILAQSGAGRTIPPSDYITNQIIVKYKPDFSPKQLELKVQEREKRNATFFGRLWIMFENFQLGLNKKDTPEKRSARLQSTDEAIGVIKKELLYKQKNSTEKNVYLLKLDNTLSVQEAVEHYKKLPEVEYAEPNYIYTIL